MVNKGKRIDKVRKQAIKIIKETPYLHTGQIISRMKDDFPKSYNLSINSVSQILKGTPDAKSNRRPGYLAKWTYEGSK